MVRISLAQIRRSGRAGRKCPRPRSTRRRHGVARPDARAEQETRIGTAFGQKARPRCRPAACGRTTAQCRPASRRAGPPPHNWRQSSKTSAERERRGAAWPVPERRHQPAPGPENDCEEPPIRRPSSNTKRGAVACGREGERSTTRAEAFPLAQRVAAQYDQIERQHGEPGEHVGEQDAGKPRQRGRQRSARRP